MPNFYPANKTKNYRLTEYSFEMLVVNKKDLKNEPND